MKTRYPIVLVHGLAMRDTFFMKSWGTIDRILRIQGYEVYKSQVDAFGTVKTNAAQLDKAVQILAGVNTQMQSPRISSAHKKLVIQEALKDFPSASSFIAVLIDAKRYNLLREICKRVHTLLDDRKGISRHSTKLWSYQGLYYQDL